MFEGLGVSFAPTAENATDANRQGQLEGLPAAIKILSLRLPRFLGARGIAPEELLRGQGGGGMDPFASSVMQSLLNSLSSAAPSPVITPGTTGKTGGTLEVVDKPPVIAAPETTIPDQSPRPRAPRNPGSIPRGNPL